MKTKTIVLLVVALLLFAGIFNWAKLKKTSSTPFVETTEQGKVFALLVEDGKIVSGDAVLKANEGDNVTIKITVNEDEELHLHGYDLSVELEKNVMGEISFIANKTGRFEFELEGSKTDLGALEIFPR